jgi:hypothetical protein
MNASYWYTPAPSELTSSVISLDFDLRAADLFFRELVVPELGRIWFARQLSWPLAALALHEDLASHGSTPPKPTAICHGIEALACKLEYEANSDRETRSRRILGTRAFGREDGHETWSFHRLRQASHYVRNTHRQAATRALRVDGGLGFASGSRFDLLELEPIGRRLANDFLDQHVGQGGTTLRRWLVGWLGSERELPAAHDSFRRALSPEHPTREEMASVRGRLLDADTRGCKEAREKRQRLADAVGRAAEMRDIESDVVIRLHKAGHHKQANEIMAARAFGAVLDRARDAVARLTRAVEPARGGVRLATLATDPDIRRAFEDLRSATQNYVNRANVAGVNEPTSRAFADAVAAADDAETIRLVVQRAGEVLGLADSSVVRGALFRVVDGAAEASDLEDGAASIEPDRTGRTFRIANLHALLRDVDQRGAR